MRLSTRRCEPLPAPSAFAGFRFPAEGDRRRGALVPALQPVLPRRGGAFARTGIEVDHVTVFRWVQRFTPLLVDAARFTRHAPGDRWFVDETYVKVTGVWRYVYRAVDQHGQVIDVLVSARRDAEAARRFFQRALTVLKVTPAEVVTDAAPVYPAVRGACSVRLASRRAARQQPDRGRSQPTQAPPASDARVAYRSDRSGGHRWARLHAEPAPRTLRTWGRWPAETTGRHGVQRARPCDLTVSCITVGRAHRSANATAPPRVSRQLLSHLLQRAQGHPPRRLSLFSR